MKTMMFRTKTPASRRRATGIHTAFRLQIVDQPAHDGIVGAADQRCANPLLMDEIDLHKRSAMMRKGRARNPQTLLNPPHRKPCVTCPDEQPIKPQPRRIAKRGKS
jgi:hypothetical protein